MGSHILAKFQFSSFTLTRSKTAVTERASAVVTTKSITSIFFFWTVFWWIWVRIEVKMVLHLQASSCRIETYWGVSGCPEDSCTLYQSTSRRCHIEKETFTVNRAVRQSNVPRKAILIKIREAGFACLKQIHLRPVSEFLLQQRDCYLLHYMSK